jgi:hypothetical protein
MRAARHISISRIEIRFRKSKSRRAWEGRVEQTIEAGKSRSPAPFLAAGLSVSVCSLGLLHG